MSDDDDFLLRRNGREIRVKHHPTRFTVVAPKAAEADSALRHIAGLKVLVLPASDQLGLVYRATAAEGDLDRLMRLARAAVPTGVVSHAYVGEEQYNAAVFYLTDQIVIELQEPPGADYAELLRRYGLVDVGPLLGLPTTRRLVRIAPGIDANAIRTSNQLARERLIKTVEPNLIERLYGFRAIEPMRRLPVRLLAAVNELNSMWHLTPDQNQTRLDHIDPTSTIEAFPTVWDGTPKIEGAGTIVSVIDVDFSHDHPDYVGRYANDPAEMPSLSAPQSAFPNHGTCCVGLLAGARNSVGSVGVAPQSQAFAILLPSPQSTAGVVKAFCDDATLATSIAKAAANARITSMSLSWPPEGTGPSKVVYDAIAAAYNGGSGCLFFFAAGNNGLPVGVSPAPGAPYKVTVYHSDGSEEEKTINYALDDGLLKTAGVVMVAASTSKAKHAWYSNWGDGIGLAAPSGGYLANEPRTDGAQGNVFVAVKADFAEYPFSGTSGATPVAAGVAALVRSANPGLSAQAVREILEDTADQIGPAGHPGNADAAYSLPGRNNRKRSRYFGYGKVNARAAVAEALRRLPP